MTLLVPVVITRQGIDPLSLGPISQVEDTFVNDGRQFILIENRDGTELNVTVVTNALACTDGQAVDPLVINIPPGVSQRIFGGFPFELYNDTGQTGGLVTLQYDNIAFANSLLFEYNQEDFAV